MNFQKKVSLLLTLFIIATLTFAQDSQEKPVVNIGGALRFNYNLSSWKSGQKDRVGDFGFDVFRINAKAKYKKLKLNAEYRFYSKDFGGGMLKQGWIGYDFDSKNNLQAGLTQVPFGITPYNSSSYFFSLNYYIGLEDDHDMGIKFTHKGEKWEYALAFFKNAEELRFGSNSNLSDSRYAYDVASIDTNGDGNYILRNKEVNQLNAQLSYLFGDNIKHRIGTSAEYGGLYNLDTEKMGSHYAFAGHYELHAGKFTAKAQLSTYKYDAKNPMEQGNEQIAMTAYGAPSLIATKASSCTLEISYDIPVKWGINSSLKAYNDFGYLNKNTKNSEASIMNTIGVMITAGHVYTYIDMASGKNHSWLGGNWNEAFAKGSTDANWETRFNINIGYYF